MDEVKAMTKAGEAVGRAIGTGLHAARVQAVQAGRTGAVVASRAARSAEEMLAERGITPRQFQEQLAENVDRAKEEISRTAARAREQLTEQGRDMTKRARKQAAGTRRRARSAKRTARRFGRAQKATARRRWPWVLGVLAACAAALGAAVLARRPQEVQLTQVPDQPTEEPNLRGVTTTPRETSPERDRSGVEHPQR